MAVYSYHSKFAKDFTKKPSKMIRYFNENVKQKISNTITYYTSNNQTFTHWKLKIKWNKNKLKLKIKNIIGIKWNKNKLKWQWNENSTQKQRKMQWKNGILHDLSAIIVYQDALHDKNSTCRAISKMAAERRNFKAKMRLPLFPSKIALCSHVPTRVTYLFPF